MKKIFLTVALSLFSALAYAETDLVLPKETWLAGFEQYLCMDSDTATATPEPFASMNLAFESMTSDPSLDNVLMKVTYQEDGSDCRYNAFLFADNAAATVKLVDSKAYATSGTSTCSVGKQIIDDAFAMNDYLYMHGEYKIFVPLSGAKDICGSGLMALHFDVKGIIKK